ncbi:MAG: rhomboid family intramembrane serine protease [Candidatus Nanohaloarchaea archaeon]
MAECSVCGKDAMTFTCKYCGEKFCSEHRLPENHECDKLDDKIEEKKQEDQKWFEEKKVKDELQPSKPEKPRKPSLIRDVFRSLKNNLTNSIIVFTSLIFLIQILIQVSGASIPFYDLFALNADLSHVLTKPWTLVTMMFLHAGFWHVFANMVTFYFFGRPVENLMEKKEFLAFYFGSGILASIGFVVVRNILILFYGGAIGPAIGASGAVVAMFAAVAMTYPEAEVLLYFFIPMKIRTALYIFTGLELFNLGMKAMGVILPVIGHFASSAHLTGVLVGLIVGRKLRERRGRRASMLDLLNA